MFLNNFFVWDFLVCFNLFDSYTNNTNRWQKIYKEHVESWNFTLVETVIAQLLNYIKLNSEKSVKGKDVSKMLFSSHFYIL